MKILIAGAELVKKDDRYMDEKSWSFMKAFEKLGFETDFFAYKLKGIFRFVEKDKHFKKSWHSIMNRKLVRNVKNKKPDILLICKGGTIEADTIRAIRKKTNTITINVMNDNPMLMGNFDAISLYHYYFVKDTYILQSLNRVGFKNIYYLPQCTNTEVRKPLELDAKDMEKFRADLMLMGSMYPYRLRLMEELINFKPVIWGKGWAKVNNPEILRLYKGREVRGIDKTKAICGADISLNPHHPLNDIFGTQSRTFDIAACKGFQLAEYKKDIEDLFKIGEEIICYKTIGELKNLVEYYLNHPDERRKISAAGYKRVLKEHTYDIRVRQILDWIKL